MTPKIETVKERIVSHLCDGQVVEEGMYPRGKMYKGFCINDDEAPLYTYSNLEQSLGYDRDTLKTAMLELRNEGIVELAPAVNEDCAPSGSGWTLTDKGLEHAVDTGVITSEITK